MTRQTTESDPPIASADLATEVGAPGTLAPGDDASDLDAARAGSDAVDPPKRRRKKKRRAGRPPPSESAFAEESAAWERAAGGLRLYAWAFGARLALAVAGVLAFIAFARNAEAIGAAAVVSAVAAPIVSVVMAVGLQRFARAPGFDAGSTGPDSPAGLDARPTGLGSTVSSASGPARNAAGLMIVCTAVQATGVVLLVQIGTGAQPVRNAAIEVASFSPMLEAGLSYGAMVLVLVAYRRTADALHDAPLEARARTTRTLAALVGASLVATELALKLDLGFPRGVALSARFAGVCAGVVVLVLFVLRTRETQKLLSRRVDLGEVPKAFE